VYVQGGRVVSADFPGIHFTINGVRVFTPFIRDDHGGDTPIGPKWLVTCSPHVIVKDYEIDYNLNVQTDFEDNYNCGCVRYVTEKLSQNNTGRINLSEKEERSEHTQTYI